MSLYVESFKEVEPIEVESRFVFTGGVVGQKAQIYSIHKMGKF